MIIAVAAIYVAHSDAEQAGIDAKKAIEQAHRDADEAISQAHRDAERAVREGRPQARSTGKLTDDDARKIAEQIDRHLRPAK